MSKPRGQMPTAKPEHSISSLPAPSDSIPSTVKETLRLRDSLYNDLRYLDDREETYKTFVTRNRDLDDEIAKADGVFASLNKELQELKKSNATLDDEIFEKLKKRQKIEELDKKQREVDALKKVADGLMMKVSETRRRAIGEIANKNARYRTLKIYEVQKIPDAKRECQLFEQAKDNVEAENERLSRMCQDEAPNVSLYQNQIDDLERTANQRMEEAYAHISRQNAILEQLGDSWKEADQWYENEIEPYLLRIMQRKTQYEEKKQETLMEYELYKNRMNEVYGLTAWS